MEVRNINIRALIKPHIFKLSIIFLCMIISSIVNLLIPLANKHMMDDGLLKNHFQNVVMYSGLAFLLVFCDKMFNVIQEKLRTRISAKIKFTLHESALNHLLRLKIDYFNETNQTQLLNNLTTDISNISRIFDKSLLFALSQLFGLIGGFIGLFLINFKLAIIVLCFIPVKYVLVRVFSNHKKKRVNEYIEKSSDYADWFADTVEGIKEIKLFGISKIKKAEFTEKQSHIVETERKLMLWDTWNLFSETVLLEFLIMLTYIAGANLVFHLALSIGDLFAFATYSTYVTAPISTLLNVNYLFAGISPSFKRFRSFLSSEVEQSAGNLGHCEPANQEIKFENISFAYKDREDLLQNVNFSIKEGEKVALIGENGCGKSTILNLLVGFSKPDKGKITIGGVDIEEIDLDVRRSLISLVSQQVHLFNTSIKNNITLFNEYNDSLIENVVKDTSLLGFSSDQLEIHDGLVGQGGKKLSGGQKQKVALARALIMERKILILDEATSNMDVESEQNIIDLFKHRLKSTTVLVVTHNPEILKNMDKFLLINNKQVITFDSYASMKSYLDHQQSELMITK